MLAFFSLTHLKFLLAFKKTTNSLSTCILKCFNCNCTIYTFIAHFVMCSVFFQRLLQHRLTAMQPHWDIPPKSRLTKLEWATFAQMITDFICIADIWSGTTESEAVEQREHYFQSLFVTKIRRSASFCVRLPCFFLEIVTQIGSFILTIY